MIVEENLKLLYKMKLLSLIWINLFLTKENKNQREDVLKDKMKIFMLIA
jgi:hypothetical protein